MRALRNFCLAILAVGIASIPAFAQDDDPLSRPSGLAIHGTGTVEVAPERLTIDGYLASTGDTADAAVGPHFADAARVQKVIDELVPMGLVVERSRYSLRSDQPLRYDDNPNTTPEEKVRVEYYAETRYTFVVVDLAAAPEIVSRLAKSGIELSRMEYDVADKRAALLEARRLAAEDALAQANAYAEAFGVELLAIRSITDGDARPDDGAADLMVDLSAQLSIQVPKTISYWSTVEAVWDIGPLR